MLPRLGLRQKHTIEAVIDRFKPRADIRQRLAESFETALKLDPRSAEAYGRLASAESLLDNTEAYPTTVAIRERLNTSSCTTTKRVPHRRIAEPARTNSGMSCSDR